MPHVITLSEDQMQGQVRQNKSNLKFSIKRNFI